MTSERFKVSGMRGLYSVAATIDQIWPGLENLSSYEVDPVWRQR
jgi:hypothetical protein